MIMEGRKENSQVIPPEAGAWLVCGPAGQPADRPGLPQIATPSGGPTPHKSSDFPGVISQISETKKILQGNSTIVAWRTREPLPHRSNSFGYTWNWKSKFVWRPAPVRETGQRSADTSNAPYYAPYDGCWLCAARGTQRFQRDMPESTKLIRGAYCAHIILSRQAVHHPWVMVRLLPPSLRPQQE